MPSITHQAQYVRVLPLTEALDDTNVDKALTAAHSAVETIVFKLHDLDGLTGDEPDLEPITLAHIGQLATIRDELRLRLVELTAHDHDLAHGISLLVALKSQQDYRNAKSAA